MNYICSPDIVWVQDAKQILLAHTKDRRTWALQDEQAFIWDMLCQHQPCDAIIKMFALIYPGQDAQVYLNTQLAEWHGAGILLVKEGQHG